MKAKIILNEIKRESNSALGSIDVGIHSMFKGYFMFKEKWPHALTDVTLAECMKNTGDIKFNKFADFLGNSYDDYLMIENVSTSFMNELFEKLKGHSITGFAEETDDHMYVHSYYNFEYKIGYVHIMQNWSSDKPTKDKRYYFVKYK